MAIIAYDIEKCQVFWQFISVIGKYFQKSQTSMNKHLYTHMAEKSLLQHQDWRDSNNRRTTSRGKINAQAQNIRQRVCWRMFCAWAFIFPAY